MSEELTGQCMCGRVQFALQDNFSNFYQCHCKQCQQLTGSAFAANLFTTPDNIRWLAGCSSVIHFKHSSKDFSKSFCAQCGSSLPFVNKAATALIVPAGSLNQPPATVPAANIFVSEEASWLQPGLAAERFDNFPQ